MAWEFYKSRIYGSLETEDENVRVAVVAVNPATGRIRYRQIPAHVAIVPDLQTLALGPEEEGALAAFTPDPGQGEI
jgi:hypothetical protein